MNNDAFAIYYGSLIDTPYYKHRRATLDVPEDYQPLADSMREVYNEGGEITYNKLLRKLIVKNEWSEDETREYLTKLKQLGVESLTEFYSCEVAIVHSAKENGIDDIPNLVKKWRKEGKTADEIARLTRDYLDKLDGKFVAASSSADWERQAKAFDEIQKRLRDRIGKPLKCFPPQWGLNFYIRSIEAGKLIVVSGGTGDGKSSMGMTYAEWQAKTGRNVIVVHMEDDLETILKRQTVRNIKGTTLDELDGGDPNDKLGQMKKMRESWKGKIFYEYCAGMTADQIILRLEEICLKEQIDDVVLDYFQKVDITTNASNHTNMVAQAGLAVEAFKLFCEKWHNNVFIISQTTPDEDGKMHTQWTRELEKKPQYYIEVQRKVIEKPEDAVLVTVDGVAEPVADVGDRTPWVRLLIKKVNDGRTGASWVVFNGPRFTAMTPQYYRDLKANPAFADEIPIYEPWNDRKAARQKKRLAAHEEVHNLPNPDEKKRQKNQ